MAFLAVQRANQLRYKQIYIQKCYWYNFLDTQKKQAIQLKVTEEQYYKLANGHIKSLIINKKKVLSPHHKYFVIKIPNEKPIFLFCKNFLKFSKVNKPINFLCSWKSYFKRKKLGLTVEQISLISEKKLINSIYIEFGSDKFMYRYW